MSSIKLSPNASGTGIFTIAAPNSNTDRTLTLPDQTGTVLTGASTANFPSGSVLQVVQATTTTMTSVSSTNTNTDTSLTASITPRNTSSRILVLVSQPFILTSSAGSTIYCGFGLKRGSTVIYAPSTDVNGAFNHGINASTLAQIDDAFSLSYVDSPASSSSVTYTTYVNLYTAGTSPLLRTPYNAGGSTVQTAVMVLMEIAG